MQKCDILTCMSSKGWIQSGYSYYLGEELMRYTEDCLWINWVG
jgi:hypothetical protein